ncbi:MAG: hypothetical protein OQK72_06665 [Gammaproteobacteria bacterium]|nr:hypothetical protein [Gammaproteobacteria bacterium]MCW9055527.1 hypothetical protein [Gammaproteobacteria bacterium]
MDWLKSGSVIFCLLYLSFNAYAIDPREDWLTTETENFLIHFTERHNTIAARAALIAEKAHKRLSPIINWQPEDKTHLVISDETDFSNAYATPYTFNRTVIFISPPDYPNSLEDYDNWLELLITHEYTHILHLDKSTGAASVLRNIFGRHVLLFPNFYQPPWLIEGIATHLETQVENVKDQGTGRGQSSFYQMMMRMEVQGGVKPVSQVNLPIKTWPNGATPYLYGVYFYQFLEDVYGSEAISGLIDAYSNNVIPFMINSNARRVLHKDITELWKEYTDWLNNKFNEQSVKLKNNLVEGSALTNDGYFTDQIKVSNNGDMYYVKNDAFNHAALIKISKHGKTNHVFDVQRGARIDIHETQGILVAQPEYCDNYNLNYDLYLAEHNTNKLKRITKCGRYRSAAWMPVSAEIIAVKSESGISELHLLDNNGNKKSVLWRGAEGVVMGQPDVSNDDRKIVASIFRPGSGWNIEEFDVSMHEWKKITDDKAIDVYPVYTGNDNTIIFSSDRDGVYNIYRYQSTHQSLQKMTNVMAGAFMAAQSARDLLYVGYSENGNNIYKIANALPIRDLRLNNHSDSDYINKKLKVELDIEVNDYSPWSSMRPRWWQPVIFIEEEKKEIGVTTFVHDALAIHNYFLSIAYDVENELVVGNTVYSYADRLAIGVARESSIQIDANDNYMATIIKDDYFLYWMNPFRQLESSWNFIVGAQVGINKEWRREPWVTPINGLKDKQAGMALTFINTKNYIRSISENDGRKLKLVYENSDIWDSDYTGEVYTFDWREFIQINNQHTLAVRWVEGRGTETPEKFRLGGEDSDYKIFDVLIPVSDALFGNREYTLRGYPEGLIQLRGRRMQLGSIEWRFPLDLVERGYMAPPVGLVQWSGSVFMDTGAAWDNGNSPNNYYSSAGFEVHADVNLFYRLTTRMRLGFASGLDDVIGEDRVYFSLGASF